MSGYRPAAVVVLADEWTDQGRLIALRLLDAELAPPLAPAWLVPLSGEWEGVLELHRVVEATQDQATFSTSDDREIPAIPLGLQGWWTPDALGLVTDTDKKWREVPFDDSRFADFCPLCLRASSMANPSGPTTSGRSVTPATRST